MGANFRVIITNRMDDYLVSHYPRTALNDCCWMVYNNLDHWPLDTLCSDVPCGSTYPDKL